MSAVIKDPATVLETATTLEQQALIEQLAEIRGKLAALTEKLRGVDSELEPLAQERRQFALVLQACNALTELRDLGGAELFWGDRLTGSAAQDHMRAVRERADAFERRVEAIEKRRLDIVAAMSEQQNHVDLLEDGLFEALDEEERLQQEWIIEREISALPARQTLMAWARGGEDDRRFRKSISAGLIVCLLIAVIFPFIPLPTRIVDAANEVPQRVVELLTQTRPTPPPPVKEAKPKPQKHEEKLAQEKPQPKVETAPVEEKPDPTPKGILAFREKLANLDDAQVVARLGSQANLNDAGATSGRPERSMLTTSAPGSSGGINLAALSRNVGGGGGLGKVQVAHATSAIGSIGKPGQDRPLSGDSVSMSRTDEEIQIVFDRYKAALYRLYNRELRKDPTLRGQMVLRLTIEADGSVSMCMLQASDMNAPELSAQVVERVKTINFGAKEGISAITILYPIDFLPAA